MDFLDNCSVAPGSRPRAWPEKQTLYGSLTSCVAAYGNLSEKCKKLKLKGPKP